MRPTCKNLDIEEIVQHTERIDDLARTIRKTDPEMAKRIFDESGYVRRCAMLLDGYLRGFNPRLRGKNDRPIQRGTLDQQLGKALDEDNGFSREWYPQP